MDVSRMSQGQQIAAVGGVLLFIFLFLPWFGDFSGWEGQSSTDIYMLITACVAVWAAVPGPEETMIPGVTRSGATALVGAVALILLMRWAPQGLVPWLGGLRRRWAPQETAP